MTATGSPWTSRPATRSLFGKWSGTEVTIDGKEMLIMKESGHPGHRRLIVFDPSTAIPEFHRSISWLLKEVRFDTDARNKMLKRRQHPRRRGEGHPRPKGRNVVIEKSFGSPRITKDGVSVAKEIELEDPVRETWARRWSRKWPAAPMTRPATAPRPQRSWHRPSSREGMKSVAAGMNPMDLKRGIDLATAKVVRAHQGRCP